jgi:hypothetical protein
MRKIITLLLFAIFPAFIFAQSVTTNAATGISYTSVTLNGEFTDCNGGWLFGASFDYGLTVGYGLNSTPTISSANVNGTTCSVHITGLTSGTTYHVQFKAMAGGPYFYGGDITFTTLSPSVPTVSIGADFSSITNNSATNTGNNATSDNGSAITDKGLVYGTATSPTIANSVFSTGTSGTGTYNGSLTSLNQLTKYYVRAFAQNGIGYGYSATEKSFITKATVAADISNVISLASQQLNITYTGGSGSNCIIYMRETDQNFSNPTDGNEYTGNLVFGSGANLGGGTYVVYSGAAAKGTITVTGLDNDKDYYFRIATYSGSGASTIYDINTEIIDSEGSQLPVSLVAFGASKEADGIELNWITNSEINNQYFAIEKSIDAVFYQEIGLVNGAGNSNTVQNYTFLDQQEITGQVYYRLRQVDYDGTINYSQAIVIETSSALPQFNQVNGSETSINLILTTVSTSSVLTINDITGKEVKRINLSNSGAHQLSLSRTQLASGVYMITLSDNQNKITKKIVL